MPPAPPQTLPLPEVDVLRIKVAHLEFQLAQVQAQMQLMPLSQQREALMKQALRAQVPEEEVEQYVIDTGSRPVQALESGLVRRRDQPEREEAYGTPQS